MMPLPIVDFPFTIGVMMVMLLCGMAALLATNNRGHQALCFLRDSFVTTIVSVATTSFTAPSDAPAFFSALFTGLILLDYAWYFYTNQDNKAVKRLAFIIAVIGLFMLVIAPLVTGGPAE